MQAQIAQMKAEMARMKQVRKKARLLTLCQPRAHLCAHIKSKKARTYPILY